MYNIGACHRITPKIGSHIAVKSSSKNKNLRAIISKKIDEMTYLVHYTDYGHMEQVKMINIFILPHKFRMVFIFYFYIQNVYI